MGNDTQLKNVMSIYTADIQGFCIAADPDDNVAKLFKLF